MSLVRYAEEIANFISAPDIVMVAHSCSGLFLPLVSLYRPVGLFVYLAAVMPEPWKSVRAVRGCQAMFSPRDRRVFERLGFHTTEEISPHIRIRRTALLPQAGRVFTPSAT